MTCDHNRSSSHTGWLGWHDHSHPLSTASGLLIEQAWWHTPERPDAIQAEIMSGEVICSHAIGCIKGHSHMKFEFSVAFVFVAPEGNSSARRASNLYRQMGEAIWPLAQEWISSAPARIDAVLRVFVEDDIRAGEAEEARIEEELEEK